MHRPDVRAVREPQEEVVDPVGVVSSKSYSVKIKLTYSRQVRSPTGTTSTSAFDHPSCVAYEADGVARCQYDFVNHFRGSGRESVGRSTMAKSGTFRGWWRSAQRCIREDARKDNPPTIRAVVGLADDAHRR